jgi:hypothetical protein
MALVQFLRWRLRRGVLRRRGFGRGVVRGCFRVRGVIIVGFFGVLIVVRCVKSSLPDILGGDLPRGTDACCTGLGCRRTWRDAYHKKAARGDSPGDDSSRREGGSGIAVEGALAGGAASCADAAKEKSALPEMGV